MSMKLQHVLISNKYLHEATKFLTNKEKGEISIIRLGIYLSWRTWKLLKQKPKEKYNESKRFDKVSYGFAICSGRFEGTYNNPDLLLTAIAKNDGRRGGIWIITKLGLEEYRYEFERKY